MAEQTVRVTHKRELECVLVQYWEVDMPVGMLNKVIVEGSDGDVDDWVIAHGEMTDENHVLLDGFSATTEVKEDDEA